MNNLNKNKPKIAIIIDKKGWAFSNAAEQIKNNLYEFYEIDIISMEMYGDNVINLFLDIKGYDLKFFMWRGIISWLYSEYSKDNIKKLGLEYEEFLDKYLRKSNIVTAVYDHLFLNTEKERTDFILDNVKAYIVCSEKLEKIYNNYPNSKKPSMVISDGVDLKLFKLVNLEKYSKIDEDRYIKVGWTGNGRFVDEQDDDLKGLKNIIKPAIHELQEEGYKIDLKVADRNEKIIPHNDMYKYYNDIDIYICASRTEGHPEPVLEAMACGVPIISTDVGIVKEAFGQNQREFIIERSKDELKKKIKELLKNKKMLKKLSEENLEQVRKWTWEEKAKMYKVFFDENI